MQSCRVYASIKNQCSQQNLNRNVTRPSITRNKAIAAGSNPATESVGWLHLPDIFRPNHFPVSWRLHRRIHDITTWDSALVTESKTELTHQCSEEKSAEQSRFNEAERSCVCSRSVRKYWALRVARVWKTRKCCFSADERLCAALLGENSVRVRVKQVWQPTSVQWTSPINHTQSLHPWFDRLN